MPHSFPSSRRSTKFFLDDVTPEKCIDWFYKTIDEILSSFSLIVSEKKHKKSSPGVVCDELNSIYISLHQLNEAFSSAGFMPTHNMFPEGELMFNVYKVLNLLPRITVIKHITPDDVDDHDGVIQDIGAVVDSVREIYESYVSFKHNEKQFKKSEQVNPWGPKC